MIDVSYVGLMADYNQWQKPRPFVAAADTLDEAAARGGSRRVLRLPAADAVANSLWADLMWCNRLHPAPPGRRGSLADITRTTQGTGNPSDRTGRR